MEIISFDLFGKAAHFRKFYSSSTALSYSIPPKTTVQGIIASILGLERDSYYGEFKQTQIGILIRNPQRKIFQKQNFLKFENSNFALSKENEIVGVGNRTQVSFEYVIPENIRNNVICYRMYFMVDISNRLIENLSRNLSDNNLEYGVSLGIANLIGYISNVVRYNHQEISVFNIGDLVDIQTACYEDDIELLKIPDTVLVENEQMPVEMNMKKTKKEIKRTAISKSIIIPTNGCIQVKLLSAKRFFKLTKNESIEVVSFL